MLAAAFILFFSALLVALTSSIPMGRDRGRLVAVVLIGFLVRPLLFLTVTRSVSFFSHGRLGGDSINYQMLGSEIAHRWHLTNVHFVTASEMPRIGSVALPCNVLALLEFVAGEPQPLAGTVVNAFFACWMVIILARFLQERGVSSRAI